MIWNRNWLKKLGLSAEDLNTKKQVMDAFAKAKDWNQKQEGDKIIPLLVDGKDYQEYTLEFLQDRKSVV